MTKYELIIRTIEERGMMTIAELCAATDTDNRIMRGYIGTMKARGYVQSVRKPKQPARYACTRLEYSPRRPTYRRPIIWRTGDGMAWVLPSVYTIAAIRDTASGHPWTCILNGWRFFGDHLEFLES